MAEGIRGFLKRILKPREQDGQPTTPSSNKTGLPETPLSLEVDEPSNPLDQLISSVGSDDRGKIGIAVFGIARYFLEETPQYNSLLKFQDKWASDTSNGQRADRAIGEVKTFQYNLDQIADVKEPGDGMVLYLPGMSGIGRLSIMRRDDGKVEINMIDGRDFNNSGNRFDQLKSPLK